MDGDTGAEGIMIEMTCWSCGRKGQAADCLQKRLAACKRCRAVNLVPARAPRPYTPLGRAAVVLRPVAVST
jgi:hypothetical protein